MKRILSVFLVALMLLTIVPFAAFGVVAETDANGLVFEKKQKFNGGTYTDYYTLADCPENATSVTIPETFNGIPVTEIKSDAFAACDSIKSINVPKSITRIMSAAISSCASLTTLTVDSANTVYYSQGNCILEKETNRLVVGCKASVIPTDSKVTAIGEYAFYRCSGITKIVKEPSDEAGALYIPANITIIENEAFCLCPDLKSVEFSDSVVTIEGYAFGFCEALESVEFGSGLTSIGNYCFGFCDSLPKVVIPESVNKIGYNAFSPCESLTDIYFESDKIPDNLGDNWAPEAAQTEIHLSYNKPEAPAPDDSSEDSSEDSSNESSDDSSKEEDEPDPKPEQPDPEQPDPEKPAIAKGDINANGEIDSMDYVLLKRAYFGTYKLSDVAIGDIDDSGKIDSMDYIFLKRAYFGTYVIK